MKKKIFYQNSMSMFLKFQDLIEKFQLNVAIAKYTKLINLMENNLEKGLAINTF